MAKSELENIKQGKVLELRYRLYRTYTTGLMNVGDMRRLCLCPGDSTVSVVMKLLGVSSGAPIRTLKSLQIRRGFLAAKAAL